MKNLSLAAILCMGALTVSTGCSHSDVATLPTIDLTSIESTGNFSDVFEVTAFLSPAVTDSTMIGYAGLCGVAGDTVYLNDNDRFMAFDLTGGNCLASFCHRGEGPEEFIAGWYVWCTPGSDGWTVLDVRTRRILSYTLGGAFISSMPNDSIALLMPLADGWVGEAMFVEGEPKRFFTYTAALQPEGTIVAPVAFRSMDQGNTIAETDFTVSGRETTVLENDTLWSLAAPSSMRPVVAFDCGDLKMPSFPTYQEMRRERPHYITYRVLPLADHLIVTSYLEDNVTMSLFRRSDMSLIYSSVMPIAEGTVTIDHNGHSLAATLLDFSDGKNVYLTVKAENMAELTGDDECNPAIVRLRIRP